MNFHGKEVELPGDVVEGKKLRVRAATLSSTKQHTK